MIAGFLHLRNCPGAKNHTSDLTIVDHTLTAFPVGGGVVFLGKAFSNCIVHYFVYVVSACSVAEISKRIGCVQ